MRLWWVYICLCLLVFTCWVIALLLIDAATDVCDDDNDGGDW
jgi:hypothetical protein